MRLIRSQARVCLSKQLPPLVTGKRTWGLDLTSAGYVYGWAR